MQTLEVLQYCASFCNSLRLQCIGIVCQRKWHSKQANKNTSAIHVRDSNVFSPSLHTSISRATTRGHCCYFSPTQRAELDVASEGVTSCVLCSADIRLAQVSYLSSVKPDRPPLGLCGSVSPSPRGPRCAVVLHEERAALRSSAGRTGEMTAGLLFVVVGGLLGVCGGVSANRGGHPSYTDEVPFKIIWPDAEFSLPTSGALYSEDDFVIMTTTEMEKYKCLLPSLTAGEEDSDKEYSGPGPGDLLEPLFKRSSCSYRIESYWTYEVCHGKHIRQYHEEKETGQKISVQEYFLGNLFSHLSPLVLFPLSAGVQVPTKNIEGQLTPYFSFEMGNGTPCVLKQNEPRSTSVLYVCHPEAKHEILSVAEVTTCEYEVVVLTPLLCAHPKYRFKSSPVNSIFCRALAGSPLRPQRLAQLDKEQEEHLKPPFSATYETKEAFTSTHKPMTVGGQSQVTVGTTHISRLTDDQLIKEFLSGSYCLHGGVGWWKYEFCYGRHVHQYHEDKEQGKNTVVVGSWNAEEHVEWAKKNVARSYQLKDDGLQKVKCKESESPHAVTVYMLEPQTCQYILGVESPVICRILDTADEHGLLSLSS
uniref:Endoplasmic reticulum lectin n=1 Tax=Scophthalmus maximus TaxID=52904 RepID=A0A8D3CDF1_SCOMX